MTEQPHQPDELTETEEEEATESSSEPTRLDEPESFPREYVQKLRDESARHRTRAQRSDDLAARLHAAITALTGRLADPSDLAFEESHLDDADALTAAIDDLLARKPHLASRRVVGDVGQGASKIGETVDLARLLRAGAS